MNQYIGHESQIFGVEEHRLVGGRLGLRNEHGIFLILRLCGACLL